MKTCRLGLTNLIGFVLLTAQSAFAADQPECVAEVSKQYLVAKVEYQTGLARLVTQQDASLAALADLNAAVQIAKAKSRHHKMIYLIETDPSRIVTDRGLSRFANFSWSPQDTLSLAEQDRKFSNINKDVERLQAKAKGHADWPRMRAVFRSKLARNPAHGALLKSLQAHQRVAEKMLAGC